jgi:hypothetical protein
MAVKLHKYSESARFELKAWIVEAALERLGGQWLSVEDQKVVVQATHKPDRVKWPEWWRV